MSAFATIRRPATIAVATAASLGLAACGGGRERPQADIAAAQLGPEEGHRQAEGGGHRRAVDLDIARVVLGSVIGHQARAATRGALPGSASGNSDRMSISRFGRSAKL